MRVTARGHPAVRATHDKTFELSEDDDIGPRATCVIGVAAVVEGSPFYGPCSITLDVAGASVSFAAEANPFWRPGGGLVVRRSDFRGSDTLAINAEASAADLDRSLVELLRSPGTVVRVEVVPVGEAPPLAVFDDVSTPSVGVGEAVATTALGQVRACVALAGGGDALLLTSSRAGPGRLAVWRGPASKAGALLKAPGAVVAVDRGEAATRVGPAPSRIPSDAVVTVAVPGETDDLTPLLRALREEGVSARTLKQALGRIGRRVDYTDL